MLDLAQPASAALCCRFQKASLYGWMGGSVCTVVAECYELLALTAVRRDGESEDAWKARQARALAEVDGRLLVLFHALVQARPPAAGLGSDGRGLG